MVRFVTWTSDEAAVVHNLNSRDFLMDQGLPESTVVFEARENRGSDIIEFHDRRRVYLGAFDEDFGFFIDGEAGDIYFGDSAGTNFDLVNEDLNRFVESVILVEKSYPFYSFGESPEVAAEAGRKLRRSLTAIDRIALNTEGSFWRSFVHDVSIGDYYEGSV